MKEVHEYGKNQGCNMATICTISFQKALNLYEKLGYKVDLERKDNVNGTSCLFLRKDL